MLLFALLLASVAPSFAHEIVTVHGENRTWYVTAFRVEPGRMQEVAWEKSFARENDAREYARGKGETGPGALGFELVTTERPDLVLWKAENEWSWEWEQRYAEWVQSTINIRFFKEHNIATDCADVAYASRWIFARIHHLPAANHLAGTGSMFSNESVRSEWAKLPTAEEWTHDRRFKAALEYFTANVYTHSLFADSYPIEITTSSLTAGAHHLALHDGTGHTYLVHRVSNERDRLTLPLMVIWGNVPRAVREIWENGYWDAPQPKPESGGFLRLRWPIKNARGKWVLTPAERMPHRSLEQYTPEFMGDKTSFAEAVLARIAPGFDPLVRLNEGFEYLKSQIQMRTEVVEKGFQFCRAANCAPGTQAYDDWSTPSRDRRIGELIEELYKFAREAGLADPRIFPRFNEVLEETALVLDGVSYPLKTLGFVWPLQAYSSDPRAPIAERWSLSGKSVAAWVSGQLDAGFAERTRKIERQGAACASGCAPGSADWKAWNTFDIDLPLQKLPARLATYCEVAPASECAAYSAAIDARFELLPWLNSDPRVAAAARWGAARERHHSRLLKGVITLRVHASGWSIRQEEPDYSYRVQNLITGQEIAFSSKPVTVQMDPVRPLIVAHSADETGANHLLVIDLGTGQRTERAYEPGSAAFRWSASGLLEVTTTEQIRWLDFRSGADPRELGPVRIPQGSSSWIPAVQLGTTKEGMELHDLRVAGQERVLRILPTPAGELPKMLNLNFITATHALGTGWLCAPGSPDCDAGFCFECRQVPVGVELSTGQLMTLPFEQLLIYAHPSGAFGVVNPGNGTQLLSFGPGFQPTLLESFAMASWHPSADHSHFAAYVWDTAPQLRAYSFQGGELVASRLLGDEDHLSAVRDDLLVTQLTTKRFRLRRSGARQALLESEETLRFAHLSRLDSRNLWMRASNGLVNLAEPGRLPLLTGELSVYPFFPLEAEPEMPVNVGSQVELGVAIGVGPKTLLWLAPKSE